MTDEEKQAIQNVRLIAMTLDTQSEIVGINYDEDINAINEVINLIEKQQKKIKKIQKYCQDKIDMYNNSEVDELGRHEYYYPPYVDDILKILKGEKL